DACRSAIINRAMTTAVPPTTAASDASRTIPGAVGWIVGGCLCAALATQAVLEDGLVAGAFASPALWLEIVATFGAEVELVEGQPRFARLPLTGILAIF